MPASSRRSAAPRRATLLTLSVLLGLTIAPGAPAHAHPSPDVAGLGPVHRAAPHPAPRHGLGLGLGRGHSTHTLGTVAGHTDAAAQVVAQTVADAIHAALGIPRIPTGPLTPHADTPRTHRATDDTPHSRSQGKVGHGTDIADDGTSDERGLVTARTWKVEPSLLREQPGDSEDTKAVRAELAGISDHLGTVLDAYDAAHAAAAEAADADRTAAATLRQAQSDAADAQADYQANRDLLVDVITQTYEQGAFGPVQMVLTADNTSELLDGMTAMRQFSDYQTTVTQDADTAADALYATQSDAQAAAEAAEAAAADAQDKLDRATTARDAVLAELDRAQHLLTKSVLADEAAAVAAVSVTDAMQYANQLKPGQVSFPLPTDSGWYDNHNWGHRSSHWASIHTGDDYSVACGTPVLAATDGTVAVITDQSWSGTWLVTVSTGEGKLTTWYAHMEELDVADGDVVKAGQVIGLVGQEGNATGCHLHFELHPTGGSIYEDTTDPDPWLEAVGAYPGVTATATPQP